MSKFRSGLVKEVRKEIEEQNQQELLRQRYNISENVKVVEKNNFTKFFINVIIRIIKVIAGIILCFFAVIGLISLLDPDIRELLFSVFFETVTYILQ